MAFLLAGCPAADRPYQLCGVDFMQACRKDTKKVATALERMVDGNLSNVKSVGNGILEYRVDFGPGYRIYFGRDGERLVVLLAGGTKKRQQEDIRQAKANWEDYRNRKTQEKTRWH
jgi:putative addiction module killer protein